jgi:hypothetical protein
MPFLDEIVGQAPKSIRPAIWSIAFVLGIGCMGAFGLSAIESKAQLAAAAQTAPINERLSKLESSNDKLWGTLNSKLDTISQQVTRVSTDVAVLAQRVDDSPNGRKTR